MRTALRSALVVLAFATPVLAAPKPSPEGRTVEDRAVQSRTVAQPVADRTEEATARDLQTRIAAMETELARLHTEQAVSRADVDSHPLWP
jgi:TolA-binding protein